MKDKIQRKTLAYGAFTFLALLGATLIFSGCFEMKGQYSKIPPGKWRAVLKIENKVISPNPEGKPLPEKLNMQFEEVSDGELPFVFEVVYDDPENFHIEIINGTERIPVTDISFGRGKERAMDSIRINFPVYETYITAFVEGNLMEGFWHVPSRGAYSIPFLAIHGKDHRFTTLTKEPKTDLTGRWEAKFELGTEDEYPAIGEFEQKGNKLTGTFQTETGDYRFLEGTVQDDKVYLSCFDGSHAFLFEAKIKEDDSLIGSFRSGKHYKTIWEAKRNSEASLQDPNTLTYLIDDQETIDFSFENPDGKLISLNDETYANKVKIVQILGTWCPNCRDETTFLVDYLKENDHPDLEVIALAFEKHREKEKADKAINTYKDHFGMNYEMVYAGYYNKKEAVKSLPMLNHILSYPTLIFLDRNNKVRRIHTGFYGPATSEYEGFVKEFDEFVKALLDQEI